MAEGSCLIIKILNITSKYTIINKIQTKKIVIDSGFGIDYYATN